MPDLLERKLTAPELEIKTELRELLDAATQTRDSRVVLQSLASRAPHAFLAAALDLLGAESDPAARRRFYDAIAGCHEFWIQLLRPDQFSRAELLDVCRYLMTIEDLLDVRLARLTPGRHSDHARLAPETVLRILDLLDQLSPGSRLILLLNHLTRHRNRRIAAKATLLIGRRLRNHEWVVRQLNSDDARIRASTIEGLWDVRSPDARTSLWAGLKDKNNRVVGNALIGLHRLGEPGVGEFVKRMIEDDRPPFRWTAAWVMGQIGSEEFVDYLDRARNDKEPHVRRAAERAVDCIHHAAP